MAKRNALGRLTRAWTAGDEHALEGELHFAPAPTPEEELNVEAWHELETAPEVEISLCLH